MTTVIQNLPTPPTPADTPAEFNSKAFSLLGALPGFVTQANQLGSEMTSLCLEAGQDAEAARLHKEAAAGSAGAAAGRAAAASTSAGAAAGSAAAASTSAGQAAGAASAAESARDAAAGYAASIDPDYLRDRANHTGTQAPDTIAGLTQWQANPTGVQSINGGQLAGLRNKIINGAFQVNQRVYVSGATTAAGQYTLDRWKVTSTAGVSFSTTANKTTVSIPAGQTLQQVIEGLNLQTGTYVLSWEGTAQGRIGAGQYGVSGAVTAAIAGGENTTIEFGAGTVANVQLEPGTVATPFEHRPYGVELALCQRYYEKSYAVGSAPGSSTNAGVLEVWNNSGSINTCSLQAVFKVEKRATPTMLAWTPQGVANCVRDGSGSDRAATFTNIGTTGARLTNSVDGNDANYSGHWTADAEL